MNEALPWPRRALSRPATRTRSSVSTPGSRPSWSSRTAAISVRSANVCGKGSIPSSRRLSSFVRLSSSPLTRRAYPGGSRSGGLDLGDLQLLLRAARRLDGDDVVLRGADQRLADRGLVREAVLGRVGFGGADDPELLRLARLLVLDVDDGADADDLGVDLLLVDHGGAADPVRKLGDALFEHRLLVLRVVVLGVLGDV